MISAKKALYALAAAIVICIVIVIILRTSRKPVVIQNANILLITIDTIRPDHVSCYGGSSKTPNLDALAAGGILFQNAFCTVPLTFPSHVSILTGLFPVHTGVHQNGLEKFTRAEFLISKLFRQNGYRTGAVVSSYVLDRKFGLSDSFDAYDDAMERMPGISSNFDVERPGNAAYDAAIKILQGMRSQKWFLWIHFYDPHTPYSPPAPSEGYDGEIEFVDQQIGKLQKWLSQNGQNPRLIVAVTGDHGESLGEHDEATHGFFIYNSTVKVPMLLSYPGAPAGKKVSTAVSTVDIAPTLLALSGIQDPQRRDGDSLLGERSSDIYLESHYPEILGWNGLQGVVRGNWKLISTTHSELYDLKNDTSETNNLYSQNKDLSASLKQTLEHFVSNTTTSTQQPDSESLEKLKSLGYIGSANITKRKGTADPKDKIRIWAEYEKSLQLRSSGKVQETLQILSALVAREPQNNFLRVSLASTYRELKDPAAAIAQLQTAIKNDPADSGAFNELALAYKEARNFNEALKAEEAALALEPERSEFHGQKGILLVETGQFEAAVTEFDRVLKMDPNNAIAWNNLGNAFRELNRPEEAIAAYRKSIQLAPHYAYPLNGLATILIGQDKTSQAVPLLEKALDLDPEFVDVYLNLGIAFQTLDQNEKAKTLYKTFLKIAPPWMETQRKNAQILLSQLS